MLKSFYLGGLILAILLSGQYKMQSQSTMFGTNPQHTGVYNSDFPSDMILKLKWKFKTNGKILATAVTINDVIYFGSNDSCLYALNPDGTMKWSFKSNGAICSTPAIKDTVIYFNNYGATFYALNINTGKEIWHFMTDGEKHRTGAGLLGETPRERVIEDPYDFYQSSPQIVDSIVYFGSGTYMYALNLNNENLIWKYNTSEVIHSTPAIYDGLIYFGCWNSYLYALNALTGHCYWVFQTGSDPGSRLMEGIQSSPTVSDTFVIFGSRDANVYAVHAKTGKKIWQQSFGGSWMPSSFALNNDTLYTGSSDAKRFYAISKATGKIYYSINTILYTFSSPAYSKGTAFIGVMNGSFFAIDTRSKKIISRFDTDGRKKNPLNAIKSDGTTNPAAFKPASLVPYEHTKEYVRILFTAGGIVSSPVIDNSTIYFGSVDSIFYALYDDGSCRPKLSLWPNNIELGTISGNAIDTGFYVSNYSGCLDSVNVLVNATADVQSAFNINPSIFKVASQDSIFVKVHVDLSKLSSGSRKVTIISQSRSNIYRLYNMQFSFDVMDKVANIENSFPFGINPNPFKNNTTIHYSLKNKSFINISIYSIYGQKIKDLLNSLDEKGEHNITWDGKGSSGEKISPGVYLCLLKLKDGTFCQKAVVSE
jgi:eukaryotic-like serine/threonine-protein kinase